MEGLMRLRVGRATPADYPDFARVARDVHEHHVAALPGVFRGVAPDGHRPYALRGVRRMGRGARRG